MPKKRKRLKSGLRMCVTKCVTTDGRRLTPASFLCFLALPDSNPVPRILNVLNQRLNWIWLSEYKLSTIRYSASEKPFLSAFFRVSYPPHTREVMGSSPIGSIAAESWIFPCKIKLFAVFLFSRNCCGTTVFGVSK